jgi:UDP-2,3-diacylglucosamine hydrolase
MVLVSDVHLQKMTDPRGALLLDLIGRIDPARTGTFVLNGDIFDFCFGDSGYYRAKYRPLGAALERLAAAGTRVVFIEGNHEFWMDAVGWRGVEIHKEKNVCLELGAGARVRITHGD